LPKNYTKKQLYQLKFMPKPTLFKQLVWTELKNIPFGATKSYQEIANAINKPRAVRAVATAIGQNTKFYLIPCHRVIRSNGEIGEYRWGKNLKKLLLKLEKSILNLKF
jgi:O-6-methylguanine DNA methyltransferase